MLGQQRASSRVEHGHWEIDTVMGKGKGKSCVLTLVERVSGYVVIGKLKARTVEETLSRGCRLIGRHPGRFLTITADNGCEFHGYKQIETKQGPSSTLPTRTIRGSAAPT